jgi:hypothetical protein
VRNTKPSFKSKIDDLKENEPKGLLNRLSAEYLEWQQQIEGLEAQIKTTVANITKKWIEEKLTFS